MKMLVTGGSGFIGSALCRHLIADTNAHVINVDKLTYSSSRGSTEGLNESGRYTFIQADISDATAIRQIFTQHRPNIIANLAAETHVDRSITGADPFIQTNILGCYVLLQAALDYWRTLGGASKERFRFLQVSTDEVYGSLGNEGLFTENTPYNPSSPYSASKAAGDYLALAWQKTYGLPVLVSNCSNNYGPYHFPEKLIPLMIISALEGRAMPVYGDGSNVRDWLYVDDHARALSLILRDGRVGETYNVGGRNERNNLQVVMAICDLVDELAPPLDRPRRSLITYVADRPGHDHRYAIDASKLEVELGWRATAAFEENLRSTVHWFLDNRAWWEPLRTRYDGQRLGLPDLAEKSVPKTKGVT